MWKNNNERIRFVENFCFLWGSAYFVAGSYPEMEELEDDVDMESRNKKVDLKTPLIWVIIFQ